MNPHFFRENPCVTIDRLAALVAHEALAEVFQGHLRRIIEAGVRSSYAPTMWCPSSLAKLVNITSITMVYDV